MVNECIVGLNEFDGCNRDRIIQAANRVIIRCHSSIHHNIVEACKDSLPESPVKSP